MGVVTSTLYQVMKVLELDDKSIKELIGDQVENVKDCFAISESTFFITL